MINVWMAVPASIVADRKLDMVDEVARERASVAAPVVPPRAGGPGKPPAPNTPRLSQKLAAALRKIDEAHTPEFRARIVGVKKFELQDLYYEDAEIAEQSIAELEKAGAVFMGDWLSNGRRFSIRPLNPNLIQYMPERRAPAPLGEVGALLPPRLEDTIFLWGHAARQFVDRSTDLNGII